ncbi:hypothetical protein FRC06_000579 [Ceratobasidium sp. 370]|nr:hypothetical protein FRC06_000579 [Ceratobasidium sp. 370]
MPQDPVANVDGDEDEPEPENDDEDVPNVDDGLTRRQRAQLRRFGDASPVVKKAKELIQLRALTEHAYPEIEPSLDQEENGNPLRRCLFDECWTAANEIERPDDPRVRMKREHKDWIHQQLSQPRTTLKKHFETTVPLHYGLTLEKSPENAARSAELWRDNNFIYKADSGQLRHIIGEYRHGEHQQENLDNSVSCGDYRGYISILNQMAQDTARRLRKIKNKLGNMCV